MQSHLPVRIAGSPLEIGKAFGQLGRPAVSKMAAHTEVWHSLMKWRGDSALVRSMDATRDLFPALWQEMQGLALGLGMDVQDVFLWNCRADFLPDTVVDSISIAVNRLNSRSILHVLQHAPLQCSPVSLVEVHPAGKPSFLSLYLAGRVPGSTIAFTRDGLVQAVNDLSVDRKNDGVPSALISRAVLGAESLADAIDGVTQCPRSGSAHHILASAHEFIMLSVEACGADRSILPISSKYIHGNAPVHRAAHTTQGDAVQGRQPDYAKLRALLDRMPDHVSDDEMLELFAGFSMRGFGEGGAGSMPLLSQEALAVALVQVTECAIGLRLCLPSKEQGRELFIEWAVAGNQEMPPGEA